MNPTLPQLEPTFAAQLPLLMPYLLLAAGGLLVMVVDSFLRTIRKDHLYMLTILVLLGAVVAALTPIGPAGSLLGGMLRSDLYTRFFNFLFLGVGLLTATFATSAYDRAASYRGEFYPLLIFAVLGMMVLASAGDLMALYLGLETMSLAVYVLVGGRRGAPASSEAGFKYLLLGGFSSAFLLFGIAMLYGWSGSTSYAGLGQALAGGAGPGWLLALGGGLLLVGLGFKVAMVPFHMWTPDVYTGAPAPVTGLMATGVKAAAFAALLRIGWLLVPALGGLWFPLLAVLAVLTMTVGNLVALVQTNLKRMLAYSSIAHAGYLLLGVLAILATGRGGTASLRADEVAGAAGAGILFYLVAYSLMNLGAFGIVSFLGPRGEDADRIGGYAGLARRQPYVAAALAVFMFSLAGIPPTVGFMGKFYIFEAVVRADLLPLAIWGVINSLLSVYYYLRVVVTMYMEPAGEAAYDGRSWESAFAAGVLAVLTVFLGVMPGALHRLAEITFRLMAF